MEGVKKQIGMMKWYKNIKTENRNMGVDKQYVTKEQIGEET